MNKLINTILVGIFWIAPLPHILAGGGTETSGGGSTYEGMLQEAKLQTIEYIENVDKKAFSELNISYLSKEIFLTQYADFVKKSKSLQFTIVTPSHGDVPIMVERKDGKIYRVEAFYDSQTKQLKIDKDLTEGYDKHNLSKLFIHEVGHMVGCSYPMEAKNVIDTKDFEGFLNEIAAGVIRSPLKPDAPRDCNDPYLDFKPDLNPSHDHYLSLRFAPIGFKCKTSKGVIYERVWHGQNVEAWMDDDTKLIWGPGEGKQDWATAVDRCKEVGGSLPSPDAFLRGDADGFTEILPDFKEIMDDGYKFREIYSTFWTSKSVKLPHGLASPEGDAEVFSYDPLGDTYVPRAYETRIDTSPLNRMEWFRCVCHE